MLDKPCIAWVDAAGDPHIYFYDENLTFDEFGQLLVKLGLATAVPDDD